MSDENDVKWYDEKNQEGSRVAINHRGLMPKCFNCNGTYQRVLSDRIDMTSKAKHPSNSCPFKKVFYGMNDVELIAKIRASNDEMVSKRNG